jgi:hypothetical protein
MVALLKKKSYRYLMSASAIIIILGLVALTGAKEQLSKTTAPPERVIVEIRQILAGMDEVRGDFEPDISADIRDHLVSLQPDAGNALLLVIADSNDNLNRRATDTLLQILEHLTWEQINTYLQLSMECYTRQRPQYPQGVKAGIETGYCIRYSGGGWPPDENFKMRTVTSRYLDDELYGQPFHYYGPQASSGGICLDALDLGRHSVYAVTEYEAEYKDWKFTGGVRSEKCYFQIVSADTPDHLAAPEDPKLDRLVRDSLLIRETKSQDGLRRHVRTGDFGVWQEDLWEPQTCWKTGDGAEGDIHVPVWELTRELPVDLCFDVEFHAEETGEAYQGDPMLVIKGSKYDGHFFFVPPSEFAGGRNGFIPVRIVLKPSRVLALSDNRITKYYTGTIASEVMRIKINRYPAQSKEPWLRKMQLQFKTMKEQIAIDPMVLLHIEELVLNNPHRRFRAARHMAWDKQRDLTPAIPLLIQLFCDNKFAPQIKSPEAAVLALENIGKPAVEPLIAALRDEQADIRAFSALTLGRIGDVRAIEPLIAALDDQEATVRQRAAEALGSFTDPNVIDALSIALDDENEQVRRSALLSLGNIRDPRAAEIIIRAIDKSTAEELEKTTEQDLGQDQDKRQREQIN